jgi:hypothetical protein
MKSRTDDLQLWEKEYLKNACTSEKDGSWFWSFMNLRDLVRYFLNNP